MTAESNTIEKNMDLSFLISFFYQFIFNPVKILNIKNIKIYLIFYENIKC